MKKESIIENPSVKSTQNAYLWIHALGTPLWAIYNLLPFILCKDLHATAFQIATIVTLKPLVSLLSVYWGEAINQRRDRLLSNVIWARILSLIPFFFFPFVDNVWFFIAAFGFYTLLARGVIPAWMEILNLNLPKAKMGKTFATGSLIGYLGNILISFFIGGLLDNYLEAWRWLFPLAALISFTSVFITARIPLPIFSEEIVKTKNPLTHSLWDRLIAPWQSAWKILKSNPDFFKFQWGFMLGGAGTMIVQPILPEFFVSALNLSYKEMTTALACCKGIGLVLTTPVWARYLNKCDLFRFASWPPFWVFLFSICLLSAQYHLFFLYSAFICYGVMEGGSSLAWNLSGPFFAKENDSSSFTNVNILSIGVRACFIPGLGALLGALFSPTLVIIVGGCLCLLACMTFIQYSKSANQDPVLSS